MTYNSEVLADSPWGYWELPETSGTTLADSSGNSRTLTISGSPTLAQTGPFGSTKAVLFSTSTPYAGTSATFAQSTATVECWFYLSSTPSTDTTLVGLAASYHSSTFDKNLWVASDGKLYWYVFDTSVRILITTSSVPIGSWVHVVATVGAGGQEIYVNGVRDGYASGVTSSYTGAQNVFLHGSGYNSNRPTGDGGPVTIALPALYPTQLSSSRISAHYNAGVTPVSVTVPAATATAAAVAPTVSLTAGDLTLAVPAATVAAAMVAPQVQMASFFTAYTLDDNNSQALNIAVELSASLEVDAVPTAEPPGYAAATVRARRLSLVLPTPTLDSRGRPT
jgi:hypothetical protein